MFLTRCPGEVIPIHTSDGLITVRLNDCDHYQARLGFEVPSSITILRKEIDYFARDAEMKRASAEHTKPSAAKLLGSLFSDSGGR